ncbi:MAG: SxtJ family membrane protein [Campylobacterota bacterium]|nr:SxtJ family membrane protein [Campylobacterota bacterium]
MVKKHDLKVFAFIWAGIFMIAGLLPLLKESEIRIWAVIVSLLFVAISIIKPELLTRFYHLWTKIGGFIGGIISKVILFILYFGVFTPVSFVLKLLGKDLLDKKIDKSQKSYWIERETQPESMKHQF